MSMVSRFKKNRDSQIDKLMQGFEDDSKKSGGKSNKNENEWRPTFDEDKGTGSAVVRFLPFSEDALPWVKLYSHGFKGPTGKWYIENSLTTLGQPDPVGELNSRLWNSGVESDKQVARDQKRRTSYYANVLVVKDPANKENEGKVFVYRFGKKIFDKIQAQANPEFDDMDPVNVFDLWEGKNFSIRMKKVAGFLNYDESSFGEVTELAGGDEEKLEAILEKTTDLQKQYLDESNFMSYEELRAHLFEVLGPYAGSGIPTVEGWDKAAGETTRKESKAASAPAEAASDQSDDIPFDADTPASAEDDDDISALFDEVLNSED